MPLWKFFGLTECALLCTQLLYFSLYFCWGEGGRGMFYVDLYFRFKDRFNLFIYYFICYNASKHLIEK